jgi:CO/xanthine dehydrogenase FAD-binding subunit
MKAFEYIAATTLAEATDVLASFGPDACVFAGGTDLLIEFRRPAAKMPRVVLDISRVKELQGAEERNGSIVIKPLVTHAMLQRSSLIQEHATLLSTAASWIGSPQIRNRGTVGGNIMNAAACADTVPPLIALNAVVTLRSKAGSRSMKLDELFLKPYQTKARPDEILTEIRFPKLPKGAVSCFIKLGRRNGVSISRLSVASILVCDEAGRIRDARMAPGATFPRWRRVDEAEQMLVGERGSSDLFRAVGNKVSQSMIAETGRRWSTEYKEPVIAVLVRRALEECWSKWSMDN